MAGTRPSHCCDLCSGAVTWARSVVASETVAPGSSMLPKPETTVGLRLCTPRRDLAITRFGPKASRIDMDHATLEPLGNSL